MSDIKVRVGQQNSVKIISSISGGSVFANDAYNLIGGVANASQLYVSGVSTFVGVSTFQGESYFSNLTLENINVSGVSTFVGVSTFNNDLYVGGDLHILDDIYFDEGHGRNLFISQIGIIPVLLTVSGSFIDLNITGNTTLGIGKTYGIAYFNPSKQITSTVMPSEAVSTTNYILTTDASDVPTWSNVIDGGSY